MFPRSGIVSVSVTTTAGSYKDLADFGFTVERWQDAGSFPKREYQRGSRPGRIGGSKLSRDPLYEPRDVIITGTVTADTFAAHLTALDNLKGWCARAVALKISGLDGTRFLQCNIVGAPVEIVGIPARTPATKVALTFRAIEDPLWYAATETTNAITTSLTQQALGTAPVRPVITFTGAPSGLTLTYANSADATVETLTLAGLTTSGATSTIVDMQNMTVRQVVSAVTVEAIETMDDATGDFFALDPKDGDYSVIASPVHPKVKYALSGGSVSAVACVYRKSFY